MMPVIEGFKVVYTIFWNDLEVYRPFYIMFLCKYIYVHFHLLSRVETNIEYYKCLYVYRECIYDKMYEMCALFWVRLDGVRVVFRVLSFLHFIEWNDFQRVSSPNQSWISLI